MKTFCIVFLRLAVFYTVLVSGILPDAANAQQLAPALIDPLPGAQLTGPSVLFQWSANGRPVQEWYFRAGLAPSGTEFANVRLRNPNILQYQVNGLPTNGVPVFVEFSYKEAGRWIKRTFEFQASAGSEPSNQPPIAADDSVGPVNAGQSAIFSILSNDSDADGIIDPAGISIISPPAFGTVVTLADGRISYTHGGAAGTGSDSLSYTVRDDDGAVSNVATVTISPIIDSDTGPQNQPPIAANDAAGPLDAGQSLTINVLSNDADGDGTLNPDSVAIVSAPTAGTASVLADGSIRYTHNGAAGNGSDSLGYTVRDDDGAVSNVAIVTISPITNPDTGPQQPTIISPLPGTELPGTDVTFNWTPGSVAVRQWYFRAGLSPGSAEFANIRFRNAAARQHRVTGLPENGIPVFVEFSYLDSSRWVRQIFEYQAINANTTINQPPVAANDAAGPLDAGQSLTINVLSNDEDVDGTLIPDSVTIVSGPTSGVVTLLEDGRIGYTHNGEAGTSSDGFTYTVQDDDGANSNIATVTIAPINDPLPENVAPVAANDAAGQVIIGQSVTVDVLSNDSDVDGNLVASTVTIVSPPSAGTSQVESDGAITYTHNGTTDTTQDTLTYTVSDDDGALSNVATVTISPIIDPDTGPQNQPPVAANDAAGPLDAGQSLIIDVLSNDEDVDGTLVPDSVTIISGPTSGVVTLLANGRIGYTHNGAAGSGSGSDTFTYTVQDDDGASSNIATVTIAPVNDPLPENVAPVAANDTAGPIVIGQSLTVDVLSNDSDADGSLVASTVTIVSPPSAGIAQTGSDGAITYTHDGTTDTTQDSLTYTVRDDDGSVSNVATVTISPIIDPDTTLENQAPVAANDAAGPLDAGQSLTIDVLSNDEDVDGTLIPNSVAIVSTPTAGTARVLADGSIRYTHNDANGTGSDSLSYTVRDDDGAVSNVATVTISPIVDSNPGPQQPTITSPLPGTELPGADVTFNWTPGSVAVRQWYFRAGLSPGSTEFASVRFRNAGTRQYRVTGLPENGIPVFVEFSYLDSSRWIRQIFEYQAFNSNTTFNQPPVATDDTAGPVIIDQSLTLDVLSNDTDADGNLVASTVTIVSPPSAGTAAVGDDGAITYTHDGTPDTTEDSLTYTVQDDDGAVSNIATVTITPFVQPEPENEAPVATDDTAGPVIIGQSLTFDVLSNDIDADGNLVASTVTIVSPPSAGTAQVGDDGAITYTHDGTPDTAEDSLTYTVQDDDGAVSSIATVTITPFVQPEPENEAPVATDDTAGPVIIGQSLSFDVLSNDTDADGNLVASTVTIVSPPSAGTAAVGDDGAITYTHDGTPDTTEDSLTYTVQDDDGAVSNIATVTITPFVQPEPENVAPVAADDTAGPVIIGQSLTFDVLSNDTDADGNLVASTVTIVSPPSAGTALVEADGQITYTHDGTTDTTEDSLTYTLQDDDGAVSNIATVTITPFVQPEPENVAPVAVDDIAGPVIIGQSLTFDVLSNDTDADGNLVTSTVTIVSTPSAGTAEVGDDGAITYTHDGTTDTTEDSLTYTVQDDDGAVSNIATVSITPFVQPEPENEAPVATDDTAGPVIVGQSLTFDVLSNDTDADGNIVASTVTIVSPPSAGTALIEANGQITYTHDGTPDTTEDSLTYTVLDDDGAISNIAAVTIAPFVQPEPENEAPVATDDTAGPVIVGQSLTFDVLSNDTDADGNLVASTVTIVSPPSAGTALIEANGQITYTHDGTPDTTEDSLTYTVLDDDGAISNIAAVTIAPFVQQPEPENEAPVATDDTAGPVIVGQSLTFVVLSNDTDADGNLVASTVTIVSPPSAGTALVEDDGQITYTHDGTPDTTEDSLTYTVQDDDGAISNIATTTITPFLQPEPENEAPVAADDTAGPVIIGQSLTFDVLSNDIDNDGSLVASTVTIVSPPSAGTAPVEADGQITYTHDGTAGTLQDVLTYTVQDDNGATSNEATVTIAPFTEPDLENEVPVAADDTAGPVIIGQSLTFDVLSNDTDNDGNLVASTVSIVSPPSAGTALVEADGQITYTHDGTAGTLQDVLTYTVQDDNGATTNEATVTIAPFTGPELENEPPAAANDTAGPVIIGQSLTFDVLSNDTDNDGNLVASTVTIVSPPSAGTALVQTDGQITYTHDGTPDTTEDSLTYTVEDNDGAVSNVATVTLTPFSQPDPDNQAPVAVDDTVGPLIIGQSLTFDVLSNDTVVDGMLDPATITLLSQPSEGTAIVEEDGRITYTHNGLTSTGADTFTYMVEDDEGAVSNEASITISPINDPESENVAPVAVDDSLGPIISGSSLTFTVMANDIDTDGDLAPDTLTITSFPTWGSVIIESDYRITYTHNGASSTQTDSFTYTVQDNDGALSNEGTVTLTPIVTPDRSSIAPIAMDDIVGPITVGETLQFTVISNDFDINSMLLPDTVTIVGAPAQGSATVDTNGLITYVHDGTAGMPTDSLRYTVADSEGLTSNEASATILIGELPELTTPQLLPLDITFDNPSWEGNAFDLLATATYTHTETATTRSTELFYADNNQWTARFVADQTGQWLYHMQSDDPELDGHSGSITVTDSTEKGFIVAQGNKWIRSATGEAFVPQYAMASTLSDFAANPGKIAADLDTFMGEHGFSGLHIRGYCQWFKLGSTRCNIPAEERNPDLETFEVVEDIILQTTQRGGTTHIWMYGDNSRNQNPSNWGLNGTEDFRVQRYLAARLGPLPGWTIGYGYDISEWASPAQVEAWYNNLNERMLYPHLSSARGNKNVIMQHSEILSYSSYEKNNPDYSWYVTAIQTRTQKPTFSEDRYRIDAGRSVDVTFEETRRGLWQSAMAGGVANIWGNMQFSDGGSYDAGSRVYPNKAQLKLYSDFMTPRFSADLQLCNALTDAYCLRTPAHTRYLIYKEDTDSISLDLSAMSGTIQYTAMNTLTGETINGTFATGHQLWTAPAVSDWAIDVLQQ